MKNFFSLIKNDNQDLNNSLVVFDGDSLMLGRQDDPQMDYPTLTMAYFDVSNTFHNLGVGGQRTDEILADATSQVDPLYNYQKENNIYIVWGGINDLVNDNRTPQQAYDSLKLIWSGRRTAGFKVIATTVIDAGNTSWVTISQLNSLIKSDSNLYDGLIDAALDSRIGGENAWQDLTYFKSDTVHLNENGNAVMAELAQPKILNSL